MPILTKERIKMLNEFRKKLIKVLKELIKKEKNPFIRDAFEETLQNVELLPIKFIPSKVLAARYGVVGGTIIGSVVKGQQLNQIIIVQKGMNKYVIRRREIDLPAGHLFKGNKLAWDGVHTLMHEYCHSLRNLNVLAEKLKLSNEQAEELIADLLSARIALEMNFPKEVILSFYSGRDFVYGGFPFREKLIKLLSAK